MPVEHRGRAATRACIFAAAAIASLVLAGCGDDSDNMGPGGAIPVAPKQRALTPAEYPAMREWILDESDTAASARLVCDTLDAAPDTPVIRATRNACDRSRSILIASEAFRDDLQSQCTVVDTQCRARLLRKFRGVLVQAQRVVVTYRRDIATALEDGPCRETLMAWEDPEEIGREIKAFDAAVQQLAEGDSEPLRQWSENVEDDEVHDPTPCRAG